MQKNLNPNILSDWGSNSDPLFGKHRHAHVATEVLESVLICLFITFLFIDGHLLLGALDIVKQTLEKKIWIVAEDL